MLKTFIRVLGEDVSVFYRYIWLVIIYGVLCGISMTLLVPVITYLFSGETGQALRWLAALLLGLFLCWGLRNAVEQAGVRVGCAILQGARHRLGDHVSRLPVGWFTPQNTALLNHLVTQGTMVVAQLPAHVLTPVIAGIVTPMVLTVVLLVLHWPLGIIALLSLPLLTGVIALTNKLSQRADDAFQSHFAEASQRVVEFSKNQSVLRAFNGSGGSTLWLKRTFELQRQSGSRLIWLSAGSAVLNLWAVQAVFSGLLITSVLWLTGQLDSGLDTSAIIAVIVSFLLASRFIDSLLDVVGYGEVLGSGLSQLDAIRKLFEVEVLPEAETGLKPRDASVELHGVTFCYESGEADVLRNINLTAKPGSMIALIGASGSGKTTLLRLIARFFDVDQGSVSIGGVDVRNLTGEVLAGQVSQIFQESYLFSGSIADNIRIGKPGASDLDVMDIIRQAGLADIVERLPQGVDTQVGEGGACLSGGERQRIAIARALIKDAPILLVDEATAALDAESQAVIASTLANLKGRCTLIVIAHQLSTVAMADQIVVLENGEVAEQGPVDELRESGGKYTQLLDEQRATKGWHITSFEDEAQED